MVGGAEATHKTQNESGGRFAGWPGAGQPGGPPRASHDRVPQYHGGVGGGRIRIVRGPARVRVVG